MIPLVAWLLLLLSSPSSLLIEKKDKVDWLIVGGGLHGVHIAARLIAVGSSLAIVDEEARLLTKWKSRAAATGMKYMRSSASFHLDVDVASLRRFAATATADAAAVSTIPKKKRRQRHRSSSSSRQHFTSDYERPSLDLFNRHCDHVIQKYGIEDLHICGRVQRIDPTKDNQSVTVTIATSGHDSTTVSAKQVVLAMGFDDPKIPAWALVKEEEGGEYPQKPPIQHVLDLTTTTTSHSASGDIVIVGGGISAVHKALQLAEQQQSTTSSSTSVIHIVSPHPLQEQQFDTHQDWMMTAQTAAQSLQAGGSGFPDRFMKFRQLESFIDRRTVIRQARKAGTVPTALTRGGLKHAIDKGNIQWHVATIDRVTSTASLTDSNDDSRDVTSACIHLSTGETISTSWDNIVLATGFGSSPPSAPLIHQIAKDFNLPLAPCGYPMVDHTLRWHPRVIVSGGLAELELGPSARNLAGARMAAERIVASNQ
ncbi:expressed unknown protein [Seminavis robusta]|uniref:L-ornithine N(5)-monooxygenase [NAD(P)H] n=1 Tax=Seminavis robusta TaxID=568900 RepID=A0A9N8HRI9_9STRA|nr:expressed unknown protein [Seminavis robusta]|eukprot:Sro1403_g269630.1 n/a (482) ;mRNA; f:3425-4870